MVPAKKRPFNRTRISQKLLNDSIRASPNNNDRIGRRYLAATECACKLTCSFSRTALKIAARLSMLGLPVGDNIRCKLLLGLAVRVASCSKPMVALTRSRKISRAVSGSPLRNRVAASSSSACANHASFCTRWMTVSLEFLVNAIVFTFYKRPLARSCRKKYLRKASTLYDKN